MELEAASSFDHIHAVLESLEIQCWTNMSSDYLGGQLQCAVQRFMPGNYSGEPFNSVCDNIKELDTDWMFLRMFFDSVYKWIKADDHRKQQSGIRKIASAAAEMVNDLLSAKNRYVQEKSLLKVHISDCKIKTERLMAEIGANVNSWGSCSFLVHSPCELDEKKIWFDFLNGKDGYSRLRMFLESVLASLQEITKRTTQHVDNDAADGRLNSQISAFYHGLKWIQVVWIQRYLGGVELDKFVVYSRCKCNCYYDGFEQFLTSVASVAVSAANHSCNYWFNKKIDPIMARRNLAARLADLQHHIGPTNPNFVKVSLKYLRTLNHFCAISYVTLASDFCHYFLKNRLKSKVLETEVNFLVRLVITVRHTLWTCSENEQTNIGETSALLVEAASRCGAVCNEAQTHSPPPYACSVVHIKICLLKAELFIMEKLDSETLQDIKEYKINQLHDVLKNLRRFSKDLPQEKMEYGKQTLAFVEEVACAYHPCLTGTKKIPVFKVKDSLFQLHNKFVFLKAELFIKELRKRSNSILMTDGKDQIGSLLEELMFFKEFLTSQLMDNTGSVDKMFQQIEVVVRRITFFSYSFLPEKITELSMEKMISCFAELRDQLRHIKAKLREICPQFPMPKVPETFELLSIDFLIQNIGELLKNVPESIRPVKHHIEEIQQRLKSLKIFLMKVSELDIEHQELKDLGNDVIRVVHKVDYVINSIEFGADWHNFFRFYDIFEELRFVDKLASRTQLMTLNASVKNVNQFSCDRTTQDSTRGAIGETAVHLRDQEKVIIDQLTGDSSKRDIISIVGMPGIGKTTLAGQVYNSQDVVYHFHCRAWCTVSQVYEKRRLLLEILSDIPGVANETNGMSDADLELKLRKCLLGKKYLIVMDDVWGIEAWNDLQISFPDDGNSSRILITTRLKDVALKINPKSEPHDLRPFSDEESLKLLEMKTFQGECFPKELLSVAEEIAEKCKGLPLAVVTISGLLKRAAKKQDWWEKIAQSLSSQIINDPEARCKEILELSYKHLPEYLKACFLYLGAFLEDKNIPVTKLIRFWLAEGFILKTDSRSLELVAEDHLMDLINRSLVIISKRRSNGKVKACQIHDLIRDFCQSKAKEKNFLEIITRSDPPYASFLSSDYGFEFESDHHFDPITYETYRLSIFLKRNHFVDSSPSGLGTRSLIFFASTDSEPRCPYDISFICQNFKFLRVLDLECVNMGISFPSEIGLLVQLRYLAVSGYVRYVPRSIANLWKLETLIVKGFRGKVILPDTIWHMSSLRHLHVNKYVAFNFQDEEVGSSFHLENLVSFSSPALSYGKETEKIFKRLPNLCKLRCVFLELWDSSKNCNQFPVLNFLVHLEALRIFYFNKALNPAELILPLNLKKLTLSHFHLPESHISAIGRLPKLEVLKLDSGAFEGRKWDMREDEFPKLKFLKLDAMDIAEWNASCDHLPNLERLVLQNCRELQKIPCDFAEITTLEVIEVHWCGQSVEESVKEIVEKIVEATGEIKVKVLISHS